jgi:glycosyltransferase involved in cell wall biosynthesis
MVELTSKPPFVSVVIVSFNYAKFLGRALDACRRQTFSDFEIVIVDNGSTDNTAEIIAKFIQENPSMAIKSIKIEENRGLPPGRNAGLDAARGEYLLFNDADDWMDENCLSLLVAKAKETQADKVIGLERYCNENGASSQGTFFSDSPVKWLHNRLQATLYRRALFVEKGVRWRDIWQEDYFINLQFNLHCRSIAIVPEVVYNYFVQNSIFVANINNQNDKMRAVMDQSCGFTVDALNQVTDPDDKSLIEYQIIKIYYLILLSYNKKNSIKNALENYHALHAIMRRHFPEYLRNGNVTLLRDNHDRLNGKGLMFLLTSVEKLGLMSPLLAAYVGLSKLSR